MAEIDLQPTEEMASNAARGLELREKHGRGGTSVGVARARDIKNRKNLSPETVRRMHAFFSRHEKNKAGGEDDAGYIAWLLWGGDSGQSWAKRKVEQMDKSENQRSDTYKEIAQRLGSAATNDRPGAKARMGWPLGGSFPGTHRFKVGDVVKHTKSNEYGRIVSLTRSSNEAEPAYTVDLLGNTPTRKHGLGRGLWGDDSVIRASRSGAKAKMGRTSEEYAEDVQNTWAIISRWVDSLRSPLMMENYREARQIVSKLAQVLARFEKELASPVTRLSRPGAKAKFATEVGRKGNKFAMITRDATGTWYAYVVQRSETGIGKAEDMLGTMRAYATEDRAKRAAIKALDTSGFSRPGAKAKFGYEKSINIMLEDARIPDHVYDWRNGVLLVDSAYYDRIVSVLKSYMPWEIKSLPKIQKVQMSRPGAKVANAVREGEKVSASDDAVSRKIRKLMDEGKPQKQAVAIALDLERRGEL